jgi:hypothetical protein
LAIQSNWCSIDIRGGYSSILILKRLRLRLRREARDEARLRLRLRRRNRWGGKHKGSEGALALTST